MKTTKNEGKKPLKKAMYGSSMMKSGGSLKPVSSDKEGLSKLPAAVRNKMGYQKTGGAVKSKKK